MSPSWVPGAAGSLHDVDHLPYGVFSPPGGGPRLGVRIGDAVLDLGAAARSVDPSWVPLLDTASLDPLMAAGPAAWASARGWVTTLLSDPAYASRVTLHALAEVRLHLAWTVGDYVDFYASLDHATNVGRIFRPDGEALMPNWRHLPVGYHGRAGSVVVSGTDVVRPCGQRLPAGETQPIYGPSVRLDLEAELGFVVGRTLPLGSRVATGDFADSVFGVVGLNDWSARDLQAWEYVPLGPFLGKSFATSVSAWVTPLAALSAALVDGPRQEPAVLPYLQLSGPAAYDIAVEVELNGTVLARPPYAAMYWSPAQMLAHLSVNGASVRVGDLFGSGTISGPEPDQRGSLLELSWGGATPFVLNGAERTFLEDGDEVVLRYSAPSASGGRLGLGEVRGTIRPARP